MFVGIRGLHGKDASYKEYTKQYGRQDLPPVILEENSIVIDIVYKYFNILLDGMGSINSSGIISVLELEGINKKVRGIYLQKIIHYVTISLLIQEKNREKENSTFKDK